MPFYVPNTEIGDFPHTLIHGIVAGKGLKQDKPTFGKLLASTEDVIPGELTGEIRFTQWE